MEPNCCPHCQRTLIPATEADLQWARDEVKRIEAAKVKADPRYDYSEAS